MDLYIDKWTYSKIDKAQLCRPFSYRGAPHHFLNLQFSFICTQPKWVLTWQDLSARLDLKVLLYYITWVLLNFMYAQLYDFCRSCKEVPKIMKKKGKIFLFISLGFPWSQPHQNLSSVTCLSLRKRNSWNQSFWHFLVSFLV